MAKPNDRGSATKNFGDPRILLDAAGTPNPAAERGMWAKALGDIRQRAGFQNASELAKIAGVSDQNVRNWEAGRAGLSPAQARQLAAILRCDWRDLYGEEEWLGPSRTIGYAEPWNGQVPFELPENHRVWQHFGDTLTGRGARSGDLICVQNGALPRDGDLALVTIAEVHSTEQRTFFAVRAGRYLVEQRVAAPTAEPIPLEGPGIAIRGVAKILFRQDI